MSPLHQAVCSSKGVLFDLFHTLTARESTWSAGPMTHTALGVSRADWERQLFETSRFRLAGQERDPVKIIGKMARAINPQISDAVVLAAVEGRLDRFERALVNIPPAHVEVLAKFRQRGIKTGLVSNADASEIRAWHRSPLSAHFDSTVFSCEVGFVKPEPEIYRHCLSELKLQPAACIFVGDGGSGELAAARALGFTTVMVAGAIRELWPEQIARRAAEAHFVIEEIAELLPADE